MPIPVACPGCSSRLNAPDAAAGKRVKCPKCQAVIVVPAAAGGGEIEVVEDPPPPPPRRPPEAAKAAARRAVEDADDEDEDRPRKKRRPADDRDDDRPRGKKKRKKQGASPGVMVGAVAAGLALVGVGFAVYWFGIRQPEKVPVAAAATDPARPTVSRPAPTATDPARPSVSPPSTDTAPTGRAVERPHTTAPTPPSVRPPGSAGAGAEARTWSEPVSPDGTFEVSFPSPKTFPGMATAALKKAGLTGNGSSSSGGEPNLEVQKEVYYAGWVRLPADAAEDEKQRVYDAVTKAFCFYAPDGKPTRRKVTVRGREWDELQLLRSGALGLQGGAVIRTCAVGDTLFFASATRSDGLPPADVLERFFGSIELPK